MTRSEEHTRRLAHNKEFCYLRCVVGRAVVLMKRGGLVLSLAGGVPSGPASVNRCSSVGGR